MEAFVLQGALVRPTRSRTAICSNGAVRHSLLRGRAGRGTRTVLHMQVDAERAIGLSLVLVSVATGVVLQLRGRNIGASKAPICLSCKGKGTVSCKNCKGTGVIKDGYAKRCGVCKGNQKFPCQVCGGTGGE
ncbi:hypothetical protein FVE85_7339 [Porphyridium purpureum]|uniref:Protein EMBRYO SAC DEVELOPMENT ARREST 3, chloroplastic n=1 Tax=Porphyridium purpureum TaxID=35688 RepID=A0A5J4Z9S4_PORPP|nr:hypothetical protein FVE85_7339 [Porphyridium purpureum]|eukprot:POR5394..scf295_1